MAAVGVLTLGSMTANSAVISYGDYNRDDSSNVVTNANTGIEWLGWAETIGLSVAEALSANEGYRMATNIEMSNLFSDFFPEDSWGEDPDVNYTNLRDYDGSDSVHTAFLSLFGKTAADNHCVSPDVNGSCDDARNATSAFYGDDVGLGSLFGSAYVRDEYSYLDIGTGYSLGIDTLYEQGEYARLTWNTNDRDTHWYNTGVALVRSTSVPEPATLSLLVVGLAGLGFARRQKKS